MPELIFHHYPNSPFSEKIRLIFGFKNLAWRSVIIPVIMPKPDLTALTGGYRRTPVLQIGADITCDSALIAEVLERLQPTPSLYPPTQAGLAKIVAQWADSLLFWPAVAHAFQPAGAAAILGGMAPEVAKAFAADRAALRAGAPRMPAADATGHVADYLARIDNMLAGGNAFLLGAQPTIADFSVYHPIWFFQRIPAVAGILDAYPAVLAWTARMAAIGQGSMTKMTSAEALTVARDSRPADLFGDAGQPASGLHGIAIGAQAAVQPGDYGFDPVAGTLVADTPQRIAIARTDAQAGEVVVHFPRVGFQLKPT